MLLRIGHKALVRGIATFHRDLMAFQCSFGFGALYQQVLNRRSLVKGLIRMPSFLLAGQTDMSVFAHPK